MTDQQTPSDFGATGRHVVECGGLRFEASFRAPAGATLRVFGNVESHETELLRFDDFIDGPHYHVPAAGEPIAFDREVNGEPLAWYVSQVRDHLADLLDKGGFNQLASSVDFDDVTSHADDIKSVMEACVPDGYVRVSGAGLQQTPSD